MSTDAEHGVVSILNWVEETLHIARQSLSGVASPLTAVHAPMMSAHPGQKWKGYSEGNQSPAPAVTCSIHMAANRVAVVADAVDVPRELSAVDQRDRDERKNLTYPC